MPDPLDEATFRSAVLDWSEPSRPEGRRRLDLVRALLAIRRREIVPRLRGACFAPPPSVSGALIVANWRMGDGRELRLAANLSDAAVPCPAQVHEKGATLLWGDEITDRMPPWAVSWTLGAP